jgi:uncharacterized protein (DUF885 family)
MIDVNQDARALADRYWEELLDLEPLIGTMMGDERFDDRLSDPSEEGVAHRLEMNRRAITALSAIDRSTLDETARTTLAMMEAIARRLVAEAEYRLDRFYAVSHLFGPGTLLAELGSLQRADTPERLDRYVTRLGRVPTFLDDLGIVALNAAEAGQTSPGVVVDRCIGQIERLLRTPIDQTPSFGPLAEGDASGRDRVTAVLRDEVWPAFERYLEVLRRYRPSATETIGLYALPNGEAIYAATILSYTTLPLDPQEVHDIGVADLEKIQEERRQISRALGFGDDVDRVVAEYTDSGKNSASSRDEMVEIARRQVQKGWDAAPGWFGRVPSVNCEVKPVEEFREQDTPGAYYQPPTADNSRPGVYYINTSDLGERPLHHVATTTYHEANPGHHFQITLEQEHTDRPALRRFGGIFAGSAFAEGWGLYSERLADQMGLFENEYERLGMLEAQAWRACRLIVDTGIHALRWDRDRSIAKMMEGGVPKLDSEIEVDRYIANPGQALAYKIGQIEIEKQRDAESAREGSAFSLRGFHDRLLALGSLPLPALRAELARERG